MAPKTNKSIAKGLIQKPLFWLLLVIFLGGCFRFYNPNWDFMESFHPDERNILNACDESKSQPGFKVSFFAYGQLPAYLYMATGALASPPQALVDFFTRYLRAGPVWAQGAYYLLLLLLIGAVVFCFSREKWKIPAFGLSFILFQYALLKIFSDAFDIWFGFLENQRARLPLISSLFHSALGFSFLPAVNFFLVCVLSFGLSVLISRIFEKQWIGPPFYAACAAVFLLGVLPPFFPESFHLPRFISGFAFLLLVALAGAWLAWIWKWGRVLIALLSLWAFSASLSHGWSAYTDGGSMLVIGRLWSAVFSTLTIGALYLLVKRLYQNTGMALLTAAFFAFTVADIEQAHYSITESFITFMFVVVALCSLGILREGSWKSYLWAGAAFGLAMAAKTSSLYYLLILLTAHLILLSRKSAVVWEREDMKLKKQRKVYSLLAGALLVVVLAGFLAVGFNFNGVLQDLFGGNSALAMGLWFVLFLVLATAGIVFTTWGAIRLRVLRAQMPQWVKLAAACGLAFFIFFLFDPWSLLDYQGFMQRQQYEWSVVSRADAPYVLQFRDTPRYWYQLENLVRVEMGWPLGIMAVLGMVWFLYRFLLGLARPARKGGLLPVPFVPKKAFAFSAPDLLILCWFIPYFGFIGAWNTKFIRYMVPTYPAFCVFAAAFLYRLFQWARTKGPLGRALKPALLTATVGFSLFYSAAYMHVYRFPHPWIESSVWIFKNVPFKSVIGTEVWADGLPKPVGPRQDPRMDKFLTSETCFGHADISPYEMFNSPTDDLPAKKEYYANAVQKCDCISIDSKKLWYTLTDASPGFRPHGFNVYPVTSRYYRLLWSGQLGFKMIGEFHNFPKLLGLEFPDDMAEETFSVYDHPRVYFFKKVETVPRERILKLLGSDDYVKGINRDIMRTITPANLDAFVAERHKYLGEKGLLN